MKGPNQVSSSRVPGAYIACCAKHGNFLHAAAGDDEVLENQRRSRESVIRLWIAVHNVGRLEVNSAVQAETGHRFSGLGGYFNKPARPRCDDDAGSSAPAARPIFDTAHGRRIVFWQIIGPAF